jgi:hypothetical protein
MEITKDADMLITVIGQWCAKATADRIRIFYVLLLQKCFDTPRDIVLLSLSSRTGIYLKEKDTVEDLFEKIIHHLQNQEK